MPVQISVSMKLGTNASARPSTWCQLKDLAEICQMLFQQLTWKLKALETLLHLLKYKSPCPSISVQIPSIEYCLHLWRLWIQMLLQNQQQSNNGREICFILHLKLTEKLYQNNRPHDIFSPDSTSKRKSLEISHPKLIITLKWLITANIWFQAGESNKL